MPLETPRDCNGSYEPKIIGKGQTLLTGFDDKIISMYARGMSRREIQGHLEEIYQVEVSAALISEVTDAVLEEVKIWQSRPLDAVYPIVYLDALMVKIRERATSATRRSTWPLASNMQGNKEVLGLWAGPGLKGSQVLAAGADRDEEPGRGRHVHRLRGWAEGVP